MVLGRNMMMEMVGLSGIIGINLTNCTENVFECERILEAWPAQVII